MALGYYTPFMILGSFFMTAGAALLYRLKPDASIGSYVGYQILFGSGIGMSLEQCNIAIQTVLPKEQIPAGISLGLLARSLSGSISVAICQNVFEQKLRANLAEILPNADLSIVSGSGVTTLIANVQATAGGSLIDVQNIIKLYNEAVVQTFLVALILAAATLPAGLLVEWKSVKNEKKQKI